MKNVVAYSQRIVTVTLIGLMILGNFWTPTYAASQLKTLEQGGTLPKPPSGVGRIELEEKQQVVLMVGGIVDQVNVDVGDQVKAGAVLVQLDTQRLEWAVADAEMNLESARIGLAKLKEDVDDIDISLAEAQYLLAKENLAVVEAGPTDH